MIPPYLSLAGALLLTGSGAQAATWHITSTEDSYDGTCDSHCSLREAVVAANQSGEPSTLLLPAGTYTLSRPAEVDADGIPSDDDDPLLGDLDVTGQLYLRGQGHARTLIRGRFNDRLFEVRRGARLVLEKLALEDGNSAHNGGAVKNLGHLVLRQVLARHNQAITPPLEDIPRPIEDSFRHGQGGAIANYGALLVHASRFEENRARGTPYGVFYGMPGRGAALFNRGRLLLSDSLLYRNADQTDGGLWGSVTGLALYNYKGQARIERSSSVDHGGWEDFGWTVVNDSGDLELNDSTLSGSVLGGVLNWPDSTMALSRVTITDGYGLGLVNRGRMTVRDSIVAGNLDDSGDPSNCRNFAELQAVGLLLNDGEGGWGQCSADYSVPLEETFTRVLQLTLTEESDHRWYHALRPGSPAIDAGMGDCAGTDQRGIARPQDRNGDGVAVCDLGAYELIP
jgi:CSLREA domain-containing protein